MSNDKMTVPLQDIKVIGWDYDGVHYSYRHLPPQIAFEDVKARVAMRVLTGLTLEQAMQLGADGYKKYSDPVTSFVEWAKEQGLDHIAIRDEIFKGYHTDLFNRIVQDHPDVIQTHTATINAFHRCAGFIQHGIATHSSIEHWAKPFLARQNLLQFFDEKAMIGLDDVNYACKHDSIAALERVMNRFGVTPEETMFVEDTLRNLAYAKEKMPGLTTVFMHHGAKLASLPAYVSLQSCNPSTLMRTIARSHRLS